MDETSEQLELPPSLRWLKWLVTALTATLILGVITIVGLLVTRLPLSSPTEWPENLALPAGVTPEAITRGKDWIGVVGKDGQIYIFDPSGKLTRQIAIAP